MNNNISKLFMFAMGAAIGSFSAWFYAKKKYEKIANDEIRSMREYFRRREKELLEDDAEEEAGEELHYVKVPENRVVIDLDTPDKDGNKRLEINLEEENDKGIYSNIIKESGYVRYGKSSNQSDSEEAEGNDVDDEPYVIRPDLFDTLDDYESMTLTYYADGVLADMFDVPVDDPDSLVGTDFAECFNAEEVNGDVVYVRNERKKTDFEIIEDLRNYSDVMKNQMRLEEDE